MSHPSFFALDAHSLDPRPGDVQTHLASCAQCQAHVAALQTITPFPAKLATVHPERSRGAPSWWRFVALGFAAATILFAVVWFSTREQPQLLTAKGTPTAALWLNRDGKVIAWNGQPILAGDSLRIEVAPAGFTHVTVFDENTRQVLYEAAIPGGTPALTPAWEFDGLAPGESLRVVLSNGPVQFQPTCASSVQLHCTRFVLNRATP